MEKRTYWPFSVRNFPQNKNVPIEEIKVDPKIMKSIYEYRFSWSTILTVWRAMFL